MRIGVNSLFLKPQQVGGAEFVLRGLLIGLAQTPDVDLYVFINQDLIQWLNDLNLGKSVKVVPIKIWGNRFISEAFQLPHVVNQFKLDGLINTNYFTPWRLLLKTNSVTIIYDLNYLHFPDLFSWQKKLWLYWMHKLTLANANHTVTISDFVRQDIKESYRSKCNIKVIYTPILWDRLDSQVCDQQDIVVDQTFQGNELVDQCFILAVANHYQHKNLATLVKAFAKIPASFNQVKLVLVGQLPDSLVGMRRDRCDDIRQLVKELGLESRVYITGYISDRELAWYYHHAYLFAFPSLFEGFGMPPVEAMGMGLPVLTTRCTAIPEVTMQRAVYVENPLDVDEWCERLTDMLNHRDQYLPDQLLIQTIRQTYDPVAIAKKYVDLFRST
ncbi:glycosyltransferase family 4 protein [Phormidium tenue]|jgi:glycosyltransferase involved in cell wall biosynthesis|uniref:Glycosyltransferase family 4 protein n=1 Tax=Phormidium tenue FACHB-1050 TaxID=2692857 RepID=A0ABR8C9P1_9CYAN|nr:glycosyltransferase family 1 protein [Phormidium tenue]MBD2317409.1 glycosyltransferase family 4 protein [Phormidium tenue FACHB-1050]